MAANDEDHNNKLPPDPYNAKKDKQTYYGDMYHTYRTCATGTAHVEYSEPNSKYLHEVDTKHDGSYKLWHRNGGKKGGNDKSKKEYHADYTNGQERNYTTGGVSQHSDSHHEKCNMATTNKNSGRQEFNQSAEDQAHGAANNRVTASKNVSHIAAGSNSCDTAGGCGISMSSTQSNQQSNHNDGDDVDTTGDTNYRVHKKDHGSYGQANVSHMAKDSYQVIGNKNIFLDCGSSSANIHMEESKITLKVSGSSIIIEGDKVTIKASKIILDGETHCGGSGGQLCGICGGGCASRTYVN